MVRQVEIFEHLDSTDRHMDILEVPHVREKLPDLADRSGDLRAPRVDNLVRGEEVHHENRKEHNYWASPCEPKPNECDGTAER